MCHWITSSDKSLTARESISNLIKTTVGPAQPNCSPNVFRIDSPEAVTNDSKISVFSKRFLEWANATVLRKTDYVVHVRYDGVQMQEGIDLTTSKWRLLYELQGNSIFFTQESSLHAEQYQALIAAAKRGHICDESASADGRKIPHSDVLSLDSKGWLTDLVIYRCGLHFVPKYPNKNDKRILFIDPLAIAMAKASKLHDEKSQGWLCDLEIHDANWIIFPVHSHTGNHWMLAVADTATFGAFLIDPIEPKKYVTDPSDPNASVVLAVLNSLSKSYSEKYYDDRAWKFIDPFLVVYSLNLWKQPAGNSWDCGVIVCAYIWAFVNGSPLPSLAVDEKRTRRALFNRMMDSVRIALMGILFQ